MSVSRTATTTREFIEVNWGARRKVCCDTSSAPPTPARKAEIMKTARRVTLMDVPWASRPSGESPSGTPT